MSDHNPYSDSFDSHPENSGCSNDDFEQVDAPGVGYYHDNGDADGPDAVGSDVYDYEYDPDQGAEVSTTTRHTGEDEAEADRYAAGASEADAYAFPQEPLISFGDIDDADGSFDTHDESVQPSAPVADIEPAIAFASSTAADILSQVAPSASPPSSHFNDFVEPISSTSYNHDDVYDFHETEIEKEDEKYPDVTPDVYPEEKHDVYPEEKHHDVYPEEKHHDVYPEEKHHDVYPEEKHHDVYPEEKHADIYPAKAYEIPTFATGNLVESVSSTSSPDILPERKSVPAVTKTEEPPKPKGFLLKGVDPRVQDLIYWRDVKKTGIVFGTMLVVLLSLAILSIISVVAYISLTLLTATFSFVIYKKVVGAVRKSSDGHPFSCLLDHDISLSEDKLKSVIKTTLKNLNATLKELRHLFLVEDTVDSIKFGILLWTLTYIGSWFSDMALIIIVVVLVFTVPKVYETYQVQIDNYVSLAKAQINTYLSIIQSKLPFLKKKEKTH